MATRDGGGTDWMTPARSPKWGSVGMIVSAATGHGLSYFVVHSDGTGSWYGHEELDPLGELEYEIAVTNPVLRDYVESLRSSCQSSLDALVVGLKQSGEEASRLETDLDAANAKIDSIQEYAKKLSSSPIAAQAGVGTKLLRMIADGEIG